MSSAPDLLRLINQVLANKRRPAVMQLRPETRLREDLGFDSLDLAELVVRIEEASGVDVFEKGVLRTAGEIEDRLGRATCADNVEDRA
jgi:acyl carrier protein